MASTTPSVSSWRYTLLIVLRYRRSASPVAGCWQAVAWRVVPGGDGEADLVVQLGRCRNVAFLLDVERTRWAGWNAAAAGLIPAVTIGGVSCGPVTISDSTHAGWVSVAMGRYCWWSNLRASRTISMQIFSKSCLYRLPEVFGVNGCAALPMPCGGGFSLGCAIHRTAPDLELGYETSDLLLAGVTRTLPPAADSQRCFSRHRLVAAALPAAARSGGLSLAACAALLAATLPHSTPQFRFMVPVSAAASRRWTAVLAAAAAADGQVGLPVRDSRPSDPRGGSLGHQRGPGCRGSPRATAAQHRGRRSGPRFHVRSAQQL